MAHSIRLEKLYHDQAIKEFPFFFVSDCLDFFPCVHINVVRFVPVVNNFTPRIKFVLNN